MSDLMDLRAAAVGTGFIGVVRVGHVEGFADTFKELYRTVYAVVAAGSLPGQPDFPTFADAHRANVLDDAVAASARDRRWVEVPA